MYLFLRLFVWLVMATAYACAAVLAVSIWLIGWAVRGIVLGITALVLMRTETLERRAQEQQT